MATVTFKWTDPTQREDGRALAASEIAFTEVFLSSDGTNFSSLAQVPPGASNTLDKDIAVGSYTARWVVQDKQGLRGKPLDKTFSVAPPPSPPGTVTGATIVVT